jgi:hypothetical protein
LRNGREGKGKREVRTRNRKEGPMIRKGRIVEGERKWYMNAIGGGYPLNGRKDKRKRVAAVSYFSLSRSSESCRVKR